MLFEVTVSYNRLKSQPLPEKGKHVVHLQEYRSALLNFANRLINKGRLKDQESLPEIPLETLKELEMFARVFSPDEQTKSLLNYFDSLQNLKRLLEVELLTVRVPYRKDRIRFVDNKGIEVVDAQLKSRFIDFEICRRNWAEHVNTSGEFRTRDLKPEDTRCVAWHDYAAKPPFFEFFTNPRIRFEFFFSLHCLRPQRAFLELQGLLNNSGWKSYDLG